MKYFFISMAILSFSTIANAVQINDVFNRAILSFTDTTACALYLEAGNGYADYTVYAVLPPAELDNGKYNCESGTYSVCTGQIIDKIECYDTGRCNNNDRETILTFDQNYKHIMLTTGEAMTYTHNQLPRTCPKK